jgi:sodium--glutamate symport carrier (gltS)
MLQLDLIQTLAFGGLVLFLGHGLCRVIPLLARYNLPSPIVGGLLIAVAVLIARGHGLTLFRFDTALQNPLMIAFFTCIGLSASVSLLRTGGPQVMMLFVISTAFAFVQNVVGAALAWSFGLPPLFGVLAGSVTLTGGPATGLAFAPLFEEAGIAGAGSIAIAMAMAGIVSGGLIGGPVSTLLIERHRLSERDDELATPARVPHAAESNASSGADEEYGTLKCVVAILAAMWLGAWISNGCTALGLTLPATIGAMLAGAAVRNFDDATRWIGLSQQVIENVGAVALSLFLVMAMMTLDLSNLAALALPLISILLVQVVVIAVACWWPVFPLMGRDYQSAVLSGGFAGFMLGTTANAIAVMRTLVERYGPAPRAFLVAPLVGAFFVDFTNALIITGFLNFWR